MGKLVSNLSTRKRKIMTTIQEYMAFISSGKGGRVDRLPAEATEGHIKNWPIGQTEGAQSRRRERRPPSSRRSRYLFSAADERPKQATTVITGERGGRSAPPSRTLGLGIKRYNEVYILLYIFFWVTFTQIFENFRIF